MTQKIKDDFNVDVNIRGELISSTSIAGDLCNDSINTALMVMSMLVLPTSIINKVFVNSYNISLDPELILVSLLTSKKYYERIFCQEYPIKVNEKDEGIPKIMDEAEYDFKKIEKILKKFKSCEVKFHGYSENLNKAFIDAGYRCLQIGQNYIDEANMLYSILNIKECSGTRLLNSIFESVFTVFGVEIEMDDLIDILVNEYKIAFPPLGPDLVIPKTLEGFCSILNKKYKKGTTCDILNRDDEIFETWSILSKKQKCNVILIGEAGVGKSAIVEALTMSIVNETCPKKFIGYNVIEINVSGMIADTKYRGEFEKKVEYLIDFLDQNDNIIVFVDEVHQLMGAGSTEGSGIDLSGSLKPILARDKIKFIGATTVYEYKKFICSDNAFQRRFETVIIEEPKYDMVLPMLRVKIENLEKTHGVTVGREELEYIELCASCFNISTSNPDKTIDIVDRSMSIAEMMGDTVVSRKHVERIFLSNFKKFDLLSPEAKRYIAYHEVGHFIIAKLYSDVLVDRQVLLISIVPGFDFLGINIFEDTDVHPITSLEYMKAVIAVDIAGGISERYFCSRLTTGISQDMINATNIARNIVMNYSLTENEFSNLYLFDDSGEKNFPISDTAVDRVNFLAKKLIDDIAIKVEFMLKRNEKIVNEITKKVLEKKIVLSSEFDELFK